VVVVGFSAAGALDEMIRYGVQGPVSGTGIAFYKPYPLFDPTRPFYFAEDIREYAPFPPATELVSAQWWRWSFVVLAFLAFVAPLAVLAAGVVLLRRELGGRRASTRALEVRALVVPSACLIFLGVLPRSDYAHLAMISPLLIVVAADLVARLPPRLRRAGVTLAVLVALGSVVPPLFEIGGAGPTPPTERLALPRGRFIRARVEDVRTLRAVAHALPGRGRPDDPILVVPMDPLVYFLSGRPNPTPYPLVLPGAFDLEPFAAALARVDTVVLRDSGFDAQPLFELMPEVYSLLRSEMSVDETFLDSLEQPGQFPLILLRRPDEAPRQRPAPLSGLELVSRSPGTPALLTRILNAAERIHVPSFDEEPRIEAGQWLLEPAVRLRPPSGWQKLAVAFAVTPGDDAALVLSLAHLPAPPATAPEPHDPRAARVALDGVGVEVWVWRREGRRLELLLSTRVGPEDWRWRPLALDLSGFAGREAVVVVAVSGGPTLEELGDEVLIGRPRVLDGAGRRLAVEPVDPASLPGTVIDELVRFTDLGLFEARPSADGRGETWPDAVRARVLRNRGLVEAGLGRERAGLDLLEAALALDAMDIETLHAAAELALATGSPELARQRFATLLERRPGHLRALEMTARLAFDAGELTAARQSASLARRLAPGSAEAALLLARLAIEEGRPEQAVELLAPLAAGPPGGSRQQALQLINQALPGERTGIAGRTLSRAREPLAPEAFAAVVEARDVPMRRATPGQPLRLDVEVANRSPATWPALGNEDNSSRVSLGYRWIDERTGALYSEGRLPLPGDLAPGAVERFRFEGAAPRDPGRWLLVLDMVQEGLSWFVDRPAPPGSEPLIVSFQVRPSLLAAVPGQDDEGEDEDGTEAEAENGAAPP
jgi:hypothetical protein